MNKPDDQSIAEYNAMMNNGTEAARRAAKYFMHQSCLMATAHGFFGGILCGAMLAWGALYIWSRFF